MRNCSKGTMIVLGAALVTFAFAGQTESNNKVETRVVERTIQPEVHFEFSRSVGAGRVVRFQMGKPGAVRQTFEVTMKGAKVVGRKLVKEETSPAIPTIYHMGRAGFQTSRSGFVRRGTLTMTSTGYDPSPRTIGRGATGRTATGMRARFGVVAVDPRVIPLGTIMYVEGYGLAVAADTGGAIRGRKIDLCFDSRGRALLHGRRPVQVHILSPR